MRYRTTLSHNYKLIKDNETTWVCVYVQGIWIKFPVPEKIEHARLILEYEGPDAEA
jgi:hypothetical protein